MAMRRVEAAKPEPLSGRVLARVCRAVLCRSAAHQRMLAANSRQVGRVEVVRELIRQSEALRFRSPSKMLRLARVAVAVADGLRGDLGSTETRIDSRAEAWACLANAQRILGELREAEDSFRQAEKHQAQGSGDPLVRAKLDWFKGALRRRQQQHAEAAELLTSAAQAYERLREAHLASRVLVTLGIAYHEAGDLGRAMQVALWGGRLADCWREPALVIGVMRNLVFYLHQAGRHEEAGHYLPFVRELIEAQDQPLEVLRLRWLEGKIALADGKKVEARAHFEGVRKGFVEQSMPYDAALVSLELALLYAESGWTADVERLASEMYPVFVSTDLPRETTASLLLFVRAVNEGGASPELIRDLLARLERRPPAAD